MLWLSRRPEWQRSREFETTTRTSGIGADTANSFGEEDFNDDGASTTAAPIDDDDDLPGKVTTRVVFQPTFDTTHTIYYRGHWLRVRRGRKTDGSGTEMLSIRYGSTHFVSTEKKLIFFHILSVVARSNTILKQLVLQAKKEYEAEAIHRIQIYFADSHGSWRWTDSRHKRPMGSIVLNPGVKEMLLNDTKDFLKSEKVRYFLRFGASSSYPPYSGTQTEAFPSAVATSYTVSQGLGSHRLFMPLQGNSCSISMSSHYLLHGYLTQH